MKIAVTGVSGHLGNNVVRMLNEQGHSVKGLVHNRKDYLDEMDFERIEGSLFDNGSLEKLLDGVDAVIHCAAKISIQGDPDGSVHLTNVVGLKNIAEVALRKQIKRFVHISSVHSFHHSVSNRNNPMDENSSRTQPDGFAYDVSKYNGEKELLEIHKKGLNVIILYPTCIVGRNDISNSFIGKFFIDLHNGLLPVSVHGGYDFVDVRKVADICIQALTKGENGGRYFVNGKFYFVNELIEICSEFYKIKPPIFTISPNLCKPLVPFVILFSKIFKSKPIFTYESLEAVATGNRNISGKKLEKDFTPLNFTIQETLKDIYESLAKYNKIKLKLK